MTAHMLDRRRVLAAGLTCGGTGWGGFATLGLGGCAGGIAGAAGPAAAVWSLGVGLSYPVQEIYPVWHDGAIWIAGGFRHADFGPRASAEMLRADPSDRFVWRPEPGAALSAAMHHVHQASVGAALWAIGGYDGGADGRAWISQAKVRAFEGAAAAGAWRDGPPLPKPVGEAVTLVLEGRIHVIGGRSPRATANAAWPDQADIADHFVLAPGAARWETAAPLPMARNSAAGAVVNGRLHVVAGRTVSAGPTGAHHIYDAKSDRWFDATPYPDPQGGLAAAAVGSQLFAGGGETFLPRPGFVSAKMFMFDGRDWAPLPPMPKPRHGHGLVAVDGRFPLLAVGGAQGVGASDPVQETHLYGA
jgi:hypothetical protein